MVSAFSIPVPLLATLQALSPHQAQKVYRLIWKLWERAGHQELRKVVYVCVCAGDGLPGLAYARSILYY